MILMVMISVGMRHTARRGLEYEVRHVDKNGTERVFYEQDPDVLIDAVMCCAECKFHKGFGWDDAALISFRVAKYIASDDYVNEALPVSFCRSEPGEGTHNF
jgi:hypothetical protein